MSVWLIAGGLAALVLPLQNVFGDFWATGLTYFFPRLGILALLLAVCRAAEDRLLPAVNMVVLLGSESLMAYTSHLIILYGSPLNPDRNLGKLLGSSNGVVSVALVLLALTSATIACCWAWKTANRNYGWKVKGLRWSLAGYLVYSFVSG